MSPPERRSPSTDFAILHKNLVVTYYQEGAAKNCKDGYQGWTEGGGGVVVLSGLFTHGCIWGGSPSELITTC